MTFLSSHIGVPHMVSICVDIEVNLGYGKKKHRKNIS